MMFMLSEGLASKTHCLTHLSVPLADLYCDTQNRGQGGANNCVPAVASYGFQSFTFCDSFAKNPIKYIINTKPHMVFNCCMVNSVHFIFHLNN